MIRLYPCVELCLDRPGAADWPTLPVDAPSHVRLPLSRPDFSRELAAVENHLTAFIQQARAWADQVLPARATTLIARREASFGAAPDHR
jgi:hypothetical protein